MIAGGDTTRSIQKDDFSPVRRSARVAPRSTRTFEQASLHGPQQETSRYTDAAEEGAVEINLPDSWWLTIGSAIAGALGIRGVQVATRKGTEDALVREIKGLRQDVRALTEKLDGGFDTIHRRLDGVFERR